ncbi:Dabb family protein [Haloferula chungangensis]|uniref:Dabb family protein n=1 Tax=Haloferula chungangensis TaxID=1048331 RepID=A0ABW2L8N6_9BACT
MVRHYGMFQFNDDVTEEQVAECFREMMAMVGKIPGLLEMEHGPYKSDEGLNEDFTHGFIMSFDTPESRDAYLPHPEHERVKEIVVPRLKRVVVFDFEV